MGEAQRVRVVQMTSAHRALDARIFYKISKTLAGHGYEVILVARHAQDETVEGIRIAAVPKRPGRLRRMTVSLYQIYRRARKLNADIYHFHDPELAPAALLLRWRGKRVVYDAHEDLPRTVAYKDYVPRALRAVLAQILERLEIWAARRWTAVIGATPPIAARFRPVNLNTAVVHNFPAAAEFAAGLQRSWPERDPAVAYVGAIARERGIFEIADALALLGENLDCRLALAGWFSPAGLKEQVRARPGSNRIDWLGLLSRVQVADLLARVRVGLVVLHPEPNFVNAKPTKLFEYMCAGIPVVASDFPLWREIVAGANCGLLVDPREPVQIAEAIAFLLAHPGEAEAMGRRGLATVRTLYDWKNEARTLLGLYRTILQQ